MNLSNVVLIRIVSLLIAALWLMLLNYGLDDSTGTGFAWKEFLLGSKDDPMSPYTVQVFMWIAFFYCMGELVVKWLNINEQMVQLSVFDLFRNPDRVDVVVGGKTYDIVLNRDEALKPEILSAIYYAKRKVVPESSFIGQFFKHITYQFQSTNDVGDVYSIVNSTLEVKLHKVDLSYTVIRYIAWLIPTLGFIGTVIGIALALAKAGELGASGDTSNLLTEVIPLLAVAFYTTLLALLLSAIVMISLQLIQAKDESCLNQTAEYCFENIVTNLKPRSS